MRLVPLPPRMGSSGSDVWEEPPVGIETFFKEFLREPFFPKQQEFVDAMLGIDPNEWCEKYTEGIALWGKGSGKDRTAAKILTYVCYKLLCMKNPVQYFNRDVPVEYQSSLEDKIEVANVCINAHLAKTVFFKYFKIMVRATRNPKTGKNWFAERGLNLNTDILAREIKFPKNITAYSLDSEEYTGEGLNLFFVIFDEIAGFSPDKAKELYTALKSTCTSRFPQHHKLLLLSYKRNDNDFMMVRFSEAEVEERTFRSGPLATWEVNLRRKQQDFSPDYARDPEGSERIYECKGATSEGGFIRYKTRISEVINAANRQNPTAGDLFTVRDLRSIRFKDWFKPEPHMEYFIHIDLAKGQEGGDACGLAMTHFKRDMPVAMSDGYIEALARDYKQFSEEELRGKIGTKKTGAVVDLVLQVKAPARSEIMFEEIRAFVEHLRRIEQFPIFKVTYDGFQSMDSIQLLRKAGVNADEQSVDRDNRAYNTLKNLIYEGLVECYWHPILVRELEELIISPNGKVDHPEFSRVRAISKYEDNVNAGSKDVADAVAGAVALAIDRGKGGFSFDAAGSGATPQQIQPTPQTQTVKNPLRYESETLVRYGEKAPDWFKKNPH